MNAILFLGILGGIFSAVFFFLTNKGKSYLLVGSFSSSRKVGYSEELLKERRLIAIVSFFVMAFFITVSCVIGYTVLVAIILKSLDGKFLIQSTSLIGGGTTSFLTYKVWRNATSDINDLL